MFHFVSLFQHMQFVQQRTLTATADSPLAAFAMGPASSGKNKGGAPPAARAHAALSEPSAMLPLEVTFGSVFDNSDDSVCASAITHPDIDVCTSVDVPSNLSVCADPSVLSMVFPSPSCHAVCFATISGFGAAGASSPPPLVDTSDSDSEEEPALPPLVGFRSVYSRYRI